MLYLILSNILLEDILYVCYTLPDNRKLLNTLFFLIFPKYKCIYNQLEDKIFIINT
jgi:hypothetical protein